MNQLQRFTLEEALDFAHDACRAAGASEAVATSLAQATVSAEAAGLSSVGFAHLVDYLASFAEGRINPVAEPVISTPASGVIQVDACGGIAQLGFDRAFDELSARAKQQGVAILTQRNSYGTGEVGYYVRKLAAVDLVSLAMSNGPPFVAPSGVNQAVFGTNPIAYAIPAGDGPALLMDQATSAAAFVKVREAATRGEDIPPGWAVDANGNPTTDPLRALKGTLLPFGGARGTNIALMVELMAAGLSGANWSLEAPDFAHGDRSPGVGLLVIAIAPQLFNPTFPTRVQHHLQQLARLGVHIPGKNKVNSENRAALEGIFLTASLIEQIHSVSKDVMN